MSGPAVSPRALAPRPLRWIVVSGVLLSLGFVALLYALTWVVLWTAEPERVREIQTAIVLYGRIVLPKALWPHWLLTCVLYALVERRTALARAGTLARIAALVGVALLVAGLVTGVVLPSGLGDLPRVHVSSPAIFASTCAELAGATTVAALLASFVLRWRPGRDS